MNQDLVAKNHQQSWEWFSHFVIRSTGFPYEWIRELRMNRTYELLLKEVNHEFLEETFQKEFAEKRKNLKDYFNTEEFRQAVFISNPDMYQHIERYLKYFDSNSRPSKIKRIEKKLFTYLQRFCGKNESASFFGPLNYGQVKNDVSQYWTGKFNQEIHLQNREAFLSYWAVRELERKVASEEELQPYIPLCIPAWIILEKDYIILPSNKVKLPAWMIPILRLIEDRTPCLDEIYRAFPELDEKQIQTGIEKLVSKGILKKQWNIPSSVVHPLHYFINKIKLIPDIPKKTEWCNRLERLATDVTNLANLPVKEKADSFKKLEKKFHDLTQKESRRGKASLYADRFVYYEEAHGNVEEFKFGLPFINDLHNKLTGPLNLSAAYGEEIHQYYQDLGKKVFDEMTGSINSYEDVGIPFEKFIERLRSIYPDVPNIPAASSSEKVKQIIEEIGTCKKVVEIPSKNLNIPLTNRSYYSLPDIFLQATNEQALQKGEVEIVLAKLHHHLLIPNWMTYFYKDKEALNNELIQVIEKMDETDGTRLIGLEVKRRNKAFYDYPNRVIEISEKPDESKESIKLSNLIVKKKESGDLILIERGTTKQIELYVPLADQVTYLPFAMFSKPMLMHVPISCGKHTPRVVIDGVVYQRERWEFNSEQLFLEFKNLQGANLLKKVDTWRRKEGLPEIIYLKGSNVRKPYWIDLKNYFCLELLQQILSENTDILIEEMFPDPNHLWFKSNKGSHSCELRMSVYKIGQKEAW